MKKWCNVCGAAAKYYCGDCFERAYCSERCQKNDWIDFDHKDECLFLQMQSSSLDEDTEETENSHRDADAVGAKFKDFDTKETRKLSKEEVAQYLGPDIAKIWDAVDVYVITEEALIKRSKPGRKSITPVYATERGLVLVVGEKGSGRDFPQRRKVLEKKDNFWALQYLQKYNTIASGKLLGCDRTKTALVTVVPVPGGASETYEVLDLQGSENIARIMSNVAHRATKAMAHLVSAGAAELTPSMMPRISQAAGVAFYEQNIGEVTPNCRYLGAAHGVKIRIVMRSGPKLESTLHEMSIALTLLHELTHFVVDKEGIELREVYGKISRVAHGDVFYDAFGAIVKSAAAVGALPPAWGNLSRADIKKYADISHHIGMSPEILPPELLGEPGKIQAAAAAAPPSPPAPKKRTRKERKAGEAHVPLPIRVPVTIVKGYRAPVPDSLEAVFKKVNAQKIRDWYAREYDIADLKFPNIFRNLFPEQKWTWPPSGNMIADLFQEKLGILEGESFDMYVAFVEYIFNADKAVNEYVKTRDPGRHTGWFVDVPGLFSVAGEERLRRMLGEQSVYDWVERHQRWMTSAEPERSVADLINKLRAEAIDLLGSIRSPDEAADFIANAILVPGEKEVKEKPKDVVPAPAPVPSSTAPPPEEKKEKPQPEAVAPSIIGCAPLAVRKGFKTIIPRSIDAIPKVSGRALIDQYKSIPKNAKAECVTAAMIWQMRHDLGEAEFAKWYMGSAKQGGAAAALAGIETWYKSVRAGGPDPGELAAWPGKMPPSDTSSVHSGWLVDVPGFKPKVFLEIFLCPTNSKISEDRHLSVLKEFGVKNAYDLVKLYNDRDKQKKLIAVLREPSSTLANVAQALDFLEKTKLEEK